MSFTSEHYADVSELIDRGGVAPVVPTVGRRDDGIGLLYPAAVNTFVGLPESGKTLAALAIGADVLEAGGSLLILDLDHNGARATVSRLVAMGVDDLVLRNPDRFRYASPEDAEAYGVIVQDCAGWQPTLVLIDSVGELLPLFGANSNSPDDFTRVHSDAVKPFAVQGAAVLLIDHLAKNTESQAFGATGTAAKKRVIGGISLRCTAIKPFKPGEGGIAQLTINKDRHGGLRAASPSEDREPLAAKFILTDRGGDLTWRFAAPEVGERAVIGGVVEADVQALCELTPPPRSQRDVKERMGWGSARALETLAEWRRRGEPTTVLPAPEPPMWGAEEHRLSDAPGALPGVLGAVDTEFSRIHRGAPLETAPRSPHIGAGAEEQWQEEPF